MATFQTPSGPVSQSAYEQYWASVFAADPVIQQLLQQRASLNYLSPERKQNDAAVQQRVSQLGFVPADKDWHVEMKQGRLMPTRSGWVDRNADWLGPVIAGAAGVGPFLAASLGAGAAAGAGGAAKGGISAGAGSGIAAADVAGAPATAGSQIMRSAGPAGAGVPDWLQSILKGGSAAALPFIANATYSNPAQARANSLNEVIAGLTPSLQKIAALNASRAEAASPLYDQVLRMVSARMPGYAKGG